MNIAEKLAADVASNDELKYLLWLTLVEVSGFTNDVGEGVDSDEAFDVNEVLNVLDHQLGMLPE